MIQKIKGEHFIKFMMKDLEYNVYIEDINARTIKPYNIFKNSRFYESIYKICQEYKKDKNIEFFKKEIKNQLMYNYWGRSEYEIVLTSWPPHIDVEEIDKLKKEIEEHDSKYSWKQVRATVNLSISEKISIYDQVMLNFDIFFNYLLENISLLKKKRK